MNRDAAPQVSAVPYDLRILQALRKIIRAVDLHSRKLSAAHQVTAPQLVCLLSVAELEPVTTSTLARQVHLSASTVVGILDRLERGGLVHRKRDAQDRRLVRVSMTAAGRALVECAPSPLQDTFADALHALPATEQDVIARSLERVVELMEARHLDAAPILETGPLLPQGDEAKPTEAPTAPRVEEEHSNTSHERGEHGNEL